MASEWGTDYWGVIESGPSEERARKVAESGPANLYRRRRGGEWEAVQLSVTAELDELADVFAGHPIGRTGSRKAKLMRGHAQEIAALILAAGYRKGPDGQWKVQE